MFEDVFMLQKTTTVLTDEIFFFLPTQNGLEILMEIIWVGGCEDVGYKEHFCCETAEMLLSPQVRGGAKLCCFQEQSD